MFSFLTALTKQRPAPGERPYERGVFRGLAYRLHYLSEYICVVRDNIKYAQKNHPQSYSAN